MNKAKIPENLNLDDLIKTHPVNNIPGFKKDKVHLICNAIYEQMGYLDEGGYYPGKDDPYFVTLSSAVLKSQFGNSYKLIIEWMVEVGIIEKDDKWLQGVISIGYKFQDKYLEVLNKDVEILDYSLDRKLTEQKKGRKKNGQKHPHSNYPFQPQTIRYLSKWFTSGGLEIDIKQAKAITELKYEQERKKAASVPEGVKRTQGMTQANINYYTSNSSIDKWQKKEYFNSQDSFGYRYHSNITQLPKVFRGCISCNGEKMVQIDLSNSQLFLAIYLLNWRNYTKGYKDSKKSFQNEIFGKNNNFKSKSKPLPPVIIQSNTIMFLKELETQYGKGLQNHPFVKSVCNGTFYESLIEDLDSKDYFLQDDSFADKRKKVKRIFLMQLFADENSTNSNHRSLYVGKNREIWNSFKSLYPEIYELFALIKETNYKNLCMLLQRIESAAMIGCVCKYFKKHHPDDHIFTLHDCLVVPLSYQELAEEVVVTQIEAFIGLKPKVKITPWSDYSPD